MLPLDLLGCALLVCRDLFILIEILCKIYLPSFILVQAREGEIFPAGDCLPVETGLTSLVNLCDRSRHSQQGLSAEI